MNRPSTFNEINSLIDHLVENKLTKDEELLSKIYADLGCTAGNIFKLRFEAKTEETVPDPFGSGNF